MESDIPPYVMFSFQHRIIRAATASNVAAYEGMAPGCFYWVDLNDLLEHLQNHPVILNPEEKATPTFDFAAFESHLANLESLVAKLKGVVSK